MASVQPPTPTGTPKKKSKKGGKPDSISSPASTGGGSSDKLKAVVRRLPPNLPEEIFWQSVEPWVNSESVSWKRFYGGKIRKEYNKVNTPSRAYIAFRSADLLAVFSQAYDGHLFRDKAGNEAQAVVEFAPCQKVPPEKKKVDSRVATIEQGAFIDCHLRLHQFR